MKLAYDGMVNGIGFETNDILAAIKKSYDENISDEFIKPIINTNVANTKINEGDVVISFNFRTDRCREITEVLTQVDKPEFWYA